MPYNTAFELFFFRYISPLHSAVISKDEGVVKSLLSVGASVNGKVNDKTALHIAAEKGYTEIAKLLLSRGASLNDATAHGILPLHSAVINGHVRVVGTLLEHNADVNSKDYNGTSSLHFAAGGNHLEIVRTLLKFGAMIDSTDERGMTALHISARKGYASIVSNLLDHGSDVNITCKNNLTALDFARDSISNSTEPASSIGLYAHWFKAHDPDFSHCFPKCATFSPEKTCYIIKRHIVRMETAHFYVSRELLSSIDKCTLRHLRSICKDELASLSCRNVGDSKISWYDIMTSNIHRLTILLGNKNIVKNRRSDLRGFIYNSKFPIYGIFIFCHYKKAERRKKLLDEVIDYSFNIFPELPWECTLEVLSNLDQKDIKNLIYACQPTNVGTRLQKR